MSRRIESGKKEEILLAIKNGLRVTEAAERFGTSSKTIYAWLRGQADNTGTSSLEISRLRRENQELKEIVGWLTLEKKRGEKNR
jgi:transposase-like protein